MITGDKPLKVREHLGAEVEIDVKALPKDNDANAVLHRIGKDLIKTEPGMGYIGTICIHMYRENNSLKKETYSMANITNIAMLEEISEQAVLTLWQNAAIQIRQYFNPSFTHKSGDAKDKRGQIK
jgi:hypothetical protein